MDLTNALTGDELLFWTKRAVDEGNESVASQRAVADKWAKGLTGLTSLLALAAVVKGQESFSKVSTTGQRWLLALAGAGFLLLLAGSLFSMRAAYGSAREGRLRSAYDLWRWNRKEDRRIGIALRRARGSFVGGLALIAMATGVTWLADKEVPNPASFVISKNDGELVCGSIDGTRFKRGIHFVTVTAADGEAQTEPVAAKDVKSVTAVPACPK